ncbi:hypothetical protein HPB52_020332 [Rhipicephalus sanguineus]|uniref:Endonuclease/exonuclease/phosphatase domain-containing protein n=1 Tax=Rhipicephalus sanguineus TaxID=34632 RepID=A0A9D4T7X7_RHISA|nr:hypothetical protein HPB52_020332 [Rhipicephalus sanguineus]
MLREVPETYTTTDPKADYILVDGPASGFPSQALIPSQHPGDPNDGQPSALPSACRAITSALTQQVAALELQQQKPAGPPTATPSVEPAALILSPPATPNACTHFATPITAPTAPPNQRAPQKLPPTDLTLPLDDRISGSGGSGLGSHSISHQINLLALGLYGQQFCPASPQGCRFLFPGPQPGFRLPSRSKARSRAWRMTHKIFDFHRGDFIIDTFTIISFRNRTVELQGLREQESGPHPTLSSYCSYVGGTTSSVLVHKSYTDVQVDLDLNLPYDYCMISVLPQGHFRGTLLSGSPGGGSAFFMVVGDFNAPSTHWGYHFEKSRGRKLMELIYALGFTMLTDPAHPTRLGNSVTRDTCPDLSLTRNIRQTPCENLEDTLDRLPGAENAPNLRRSPHPGLGPTSQRANDLCDRYLSRTVEPIGPEYIYSGLLNTEIDAPFALADLRAAFAKMKQGTAPGRDGITVSLLTNLPD